MAYLPGYAVELVDVWHPTDFAVPNGPVLKLQLRRRRTVRHSVVVEAKSGLDSVTRPDLVGSVYYAST